MLDQIKALYRELYATEPPQSPSKLQDNRSGNAKNNEPDNCKARSPKSRTEKGGNSKQSAMQTESPPIDYSDYYKTANPETKLEKTGIQNLSNNELLCLLLSKPGEQDKTVQSLAAKVAKLLLCQQFAINRQELLQIEGIQTHNSTTILAAIEWARRFPHPQPRQLNNPAAIYQQIVHFADEQENLIAINLNGACESLSVRLITRGTVNRSLIHPREVFTHAVREQANSVVIAHNHPSGNLQPSKEDLQSTQRLQEAGNILGIQLLDHIIFSETEYLSLAKCGLLH